VGSLQGFLAVGLIFMVVGVYLFENLRGDTGFAALDVWMLIAGLGVGPTMAIFTLIVQNDVPFERLGTATSDLTLFRQIGTSVGLTMAFTLFRDNLTWDSIRSAIVSAGAPASQVPLMPRRLSTPTSSSPSAARFPGHSLNSRPGSGSHSPRASTRPSRSRSPTRCGSACSPRPSPSLPSLSSRRSRSVPTSTPIKPPELDFTIGQRGR